MKTVDREELEGLIAEAINESLEMDWRPRDGARAVLRAFDENGILATTTRTET